MFDVRTALSKTVVSETDVCDYCPVVARTPSVLCADVQYIFLVGGLSESPLLQQATREKFGSRAQVLVPQEASLAVLKGTLFLVM